MLNTTESYLIRNIDQSVSRQEGKSMKSDNHKLLRRVTWQDLDARLSDLSEKKIVYVINNIGYFKLFALLNQGWATKYGPWTK